MRILKRLIILSILLFCLKINLSAQKTGWGFNVSFSPEMTWANASESVKNDGLRFGFDFTVQGENYFSERYAYYAGISFMNFSSKIENETGSILQFKSETELWPGETMKTRLQYLTFPVGLKFKTPDYGMLAYYFQVGLFPGIRVGGKMFQPDGSSYSIYKDSNIMTCGTQLGAGCMYATGENTYVVGGIDFKYCFVDAMSANNIKAFPVSIGLRIGFLF
jgi:hypothetical protein